MLVMFFFVGLDVISPFSSRTMPNNFFTGTVVEPSLVTLASTLHATVSPGRWRKLHLPSSARSRRWRDRQRGAGADDVLHGLQAGDICSLVR